MNKYIVMRDFQSETLKEKIRSAGYSQKRISEHLGISAKTMQHYMKSQSMPEYRLMGIMKILEESAT